MKENITYLLLATSLLFFQCGGSNTKKSTEAPKQNVEEEKKKEEEPLLSQDDVVERLTSYGQTHNDSIVAIETPFGKMKILLYSGTPLHKANFLRLVERHYYDETYFHRVVPNFVAQGGGTDIRKKVKIGKYKIPSEFAPEQYFHKRGAVAMARYDEDNPEKMSDSNEFYIVGAGRKTKSELRGITKEYGVKFNASQIKAYTTVGGAPHLDGNYTVFGEVIEGFNVIDSLMAVEVDKRGWPKYIDVSIKASLEK